jgi:hypothetical protein
LIALVAASALSAPVVALAQGQEARPQPVQLSTPLPQPRDIAYPGQLTIDVDARDTFARHLPRAADHPGRAGRADDAFLSRMAARQPRPARADATIAGLRVTANGRPLAWVRDPAYVHAFHIDVPQGVRALDVAFDHLSPTEGAQGRIVMTPDMLNVQWEKLSLYPAGYFTRNIPIQASVTLPEGFQAATRWTSRTGAAAASAIGRSPTRRWSIPRCSRAFTTGREALARDVNLHLFADRPEDLAATPEQIAAHRRLVEQTLKLTGAKHYDEYEFLVALTDELGDIGLEHLRSSENGPPAQLLHRHGAAARPGGICSPTNISTAGTASTAGPPTIGSRPSRRRSATACSGSTRARRNSGATCLSARSA